MVRRQSVYAEVTFLGSHVNIPKLNVFLNLVANDGGYVYYQKISHLNAAVIGVDVPLEGKNRTKRLYIHMGGDSVKFRYHPTKERRFQPYRDALEKLKEMIEDEGSGAEKDYYDKNAMPIILDLR